MKKSMILTLFVTFMLANIVFSQNYETLHIDSFIVQRYCSNDDLYGVVVYGENNCHGQSWYVTMWDGYDEVVFLEQDDVDSVIIYNQHRYLEYYIHCNGCENSYENTVVFEVTYTSENPFSEPVIWKHWNESVMLDADPNWFGFQFLWSTNEVTNTIEVTEQGTYSVTLTDMCGSATYSVDVLNILEIYRAGVDLASRKNKPTWRTTPEQALHIKDVQVIRDGIPVGVAPFEQCYYLDSIGSDDAARTYQLVAILYDGTVCPYSSYRIGTPHVDYSQNASNPNKLNFAWTNPFIEEGAPISIAYVLICKYDPYTGQVTIIDQLDPSNTIGSYDKDKFNNGYAAVGFIFNEGESEAEMRQNLDKKLKKFAKDVTMTLDEFDEVAFGNMSQDIILAVGEHHVNPINVYPNPCDGAFTVTGVSNLVIYNILGQVVTTSYSESGTHNLSLGYGLYILKDPEGNVAKLIIK